ncbi:MULTISPECIES: pleiotropic regulatory protein RsmS [unclassified Agarivorans]|uniref:pleiotropic regulatory protein RsmS n=1 Tax=unclassified Agarivorans TaxID=2636026 RepID=UPI003D7C96BF
MSLNQAPKHIQLAVDLIQLLEQHNLEAQTVLDALEIVNQDYQRKLKQTAAQFSNSIDIEA